MRFLENSGYLYILRLVDYITVAHLVTNLVIPTTIESLDTVKDTLRALLTVKVRFYLTKGKMLKIDMDCANFFHRIILSAFINLNMLLFWRIFAQHHRPFHPTPSHHLYFLCQGTSVYRNASFRN